MSKQENKPTLGEIVGEMKNDVVRISSKLRKGSYTALKSFGKGCLKNGKEFGTYFLVMATTPYTIPSIFIGELSEKDKPTIACSNFGECGGLSGIASWLAQGYGYYYLCKREHYEALLLPIVTNLAYGVYEWAISAKRKVAERKLKNSNLENKTE